jgi:hypothetical protein
MQLLVAAVHRAVGMLGDTFAAITLEDAEGRVLRATPSYIPHERLILTLVIRHQLHAKLVHQPSQPNATVLRFAVLTPPNPSVEHDINANMHRQWQRLRQLLDRLQGTQQKLSLGNEYVEYLRASLKRGEPHDESVSLQARPSGLDLDEDMMNDLH